VRTAILAAGCLLVGLVVGLLGGLAIGGGGSEAAQSNPKTVTVERTVEVTISQEASTSSSTSASASASAGLGPEQATKSCDMGQECDLGPGTVVIEQAQKTDTLTSDFSSPMSGNFVVVNFTYTWNGDQPVSLGEIPWTLTDGDGTTYTYDFDATNNFSDYQENIIYAEVQPGVAKRGKAIFSVAPDAQDFTLTITDLATPQAGETANVEL
jgi:hypothetical protein